MVRFNVSSSTVNMRASDEQIGMKVDNAVVVYNTAPETDPTVPEWAKQPEPPKTIGEDVSGTTQTPYTVDEANNYAYIYDEPVEAQKGAEIFNSYDGESEYGSDRNIAIGYMSQASGFRTQAIGNYSKAEGWWTRADGQCSVASGLLSVASGHFSHAEGTRTQATINNAHAEGDETIASGKQSHAEGQGTVASGFCSHAEGSQTQATNYYSHAEGLGTIAAGRNQTAMGKYNVKDTTSLLIVGNGTKNSARKNAFKVDANGNGWFDGTVETDGVILRGSDGAIHTLTVDENGALNLPAAGGSVNEEQVREIIEQHLAENPPINGTDGKDGADGYTPVKGVDYFTDAEVQQIAQEAANLVTIDQVLPEQVVFPNGASTTYAIGKVQLTNGMGELVPAGGTLKDFFNCFVDEKNPSKTDPSVSLTFSQAKAYEVGTKVTPTYSASLKAGSYTYGPDTGVVASAWSVTDTAGNTARTTASGSFPQFTVVDNISYKITAKATHNAGAVPVTNTGNPYPAAQIAAGTKSATSGAVTGYRNTFYGTLTAKSDPTSAIVRGLASKSGKALANGNSFTVTVPVGALRVMIAYPATLRDVNSIKDVNGMNAEISSGFTKQTVNVEGANGHDAISYKVYTMDFAAANDKENKFTVVI